MIIIPLLTAIVTQIIKLIIDGIPNNLNWQYLLNDYGGWPSSHSALTTSLALMVGLENGFDSTAFAICFVLLLIVVRDAVGFRREIGKNSALTNTLAQELFPTNPEIKLREKIGHTNFEAISGIIVGAILTFLFYGLMLYL